MHSLWSTFYIFARLIESRIQFCIYIECATIPFSSSALDGILVKCELRSFNILSSYVIRKWFGDNVTLILVVAVINAIFKLRVVKFILQILHADLTFYERLSEQLFRSYKSKFNSINWNVCLPCIYVLHLLALCLHIRTATSTCYNLNTNNRSTGEIWTFWTWTHSYYVIIIIWCSHSNLTRNEDELRRVNLVNPIDRNPLMFVTQRL